jgi:nitrite reductase/ring-hydroxylating ferredoxin subunit
MDDWTTACSLADLPDEKPLRVSVGGVDVLLYRAGDNVFAVGNRCTHQGAPLHKGVVKADGSPRSVTCPIHGSVFSLEGSRVLRGPATAPLPAFDARMSGDEVQIRNRQGI